MCVTRLVVRGRGRDGGKIGGGGEEREGIRRKGRGREREGG